MRIYHGIRKTDGSAHVFVEDEDVMKPLTSRNDLINHSPDGFEWGYAGSGPAQLALAVLADCIGDELAMQYYQRFKDAVITNLDREANWEMTSNQVKVAIMKIQDRNASYE